MVSKGVYTSDDTHFHNKEARLRGATSPLAQPGGAAGEEPAVPQGCPGS